MRINLNIVHLDENISKRKLAFFIFLIILIGAISFTGLNGSLQNLDECLYANISRETFENRSLIPLKEGQFYVHKSPLMFWSVLLSFKLFGVNDFAAKFTSALANAVTSIFILLISRKLFKSSIAGTIAVLIYLTSLQVYGSSHQLATDSLMVMTIFGSLFFSLKGLDDRKAWFFLAAVFNGMTFLTKSAMGLIVPVTLFLYILFQKRWDIFPFLILYVLISLAISAPYFLFIYRKAPDLFIKTFLKANILGRFYRKGGVNIETIGAIISAGIQYIALLFLFLLPFSPGMFFLFYRKGEEGSMKDILWDKLSKFISIYFVIVLIGFAISSANGVWTHYTLPMIPAVSLFLGITLKKIKNQKIFLYFAFIAFLAIAVVTGVYIKIHRTYPTYRDVIIGLAIVYLLFVIYNFIFYFSKIKANRGILYGTVMFFICFTIFTAITVPLDFNADIKSFSEVVYEEQSPLIIINTKEVNEGGNKRRAAYWYLKMRDSEYRTFDHFINKSDKIKRGTYLIYYNGYERKLKSIHSSFKVLKTGKIWNIGVIE